MRNWMTKMVICFCFAALLLSSAARAQDGEGCTNATLKGDYAFTVSGTFWTGPSNSIAVQREGVAMTHFDGEGKLSQVDFVKSSPNAPTPPGTPPSDPATGFHNGEEGTYTVYKDCTGTFTIANPDFLNTSIPGPVITVKFVLSDGGRAIHTIVTSLVTAGPNGPVSLAVLIRSEGHKL